MADLKRDLDSLRLEPEPEATGRWRWIVAVLLVLATAGGAFWWRTRDSYGLTDVDVVRPTVTSAETATAGAPMLTASGYLVARREAVVSAKIQGRLSELRVEEGSVVKAGEIIARLESSDYEAQLARARAQLKRAEAQVVTADATIARAEAELAELRRQRGVTARLVADKVAPADQLDAADGKIRVAEATTGQTIADKARAQAEEQQARAEVALNDAFLQNTVIRAPFAGTVVKKMAEVGESVAPIPPGVNLSTSSGAIVALADLATIEMEADVSESNVAKLSAAQPAEVSVEAFPERTYRATVRQIIPTADRTKATVQVKVTLLDEDERLKPEMSAKVTFLEPAAQSADGTAQPERIVAVPPGAVVVRDGVSHVYEVVQDTIRIRRIVPGASLPDRIIVKEGLSGTERLVTSPPPDLTEGARVRVKGSQS